MKPSTNRGEIRSRRMEGRVPAEIQRERATPALERIEDIPPYLLSPEGMEAPRPEVTELAPVTPHARKPQGGRLLEALRSGTIGRREPAHRGFDPHGTNLRQAPVVHLREHRVHGRGQ